MFFFLSCIPVNLLEINVLSLTLLPLSPHGVTSGNSFVIPMGEISVVGKLFAVFSQKCKCLDNS